MLLQGKKILLGISGSIAAYKTPELVRQLIKQGAEVKVILTQGGAQFVTPLALGTVSKHEVFLDISNGAQWHNHVELGMWADLLLIAPCSANTMAKMANGLCDNMLLATYLSAKCPIAFAPAMDLDMWTHPATQTNLQTLLSFPKHHYIAPEYGTLASGLVGIGRMPNPESIVLWCKKYFYDILEKKGKALISAGPTYEAIDPVRFIGNHSTGKMGIAIAEALVEQGYEVTLVLGPTALTTSMPGINIVKVTDATSMYNACMQHFDEVQIAIMSAAVADFTPIQKSDIKIKKQGDGGIAVQLGQTKDILAALGQRKTHQILVGFALETNNEIENAKSKLLRKNADFIILNTLNDIGAGFGYDTNKVYIVEKNDKVTSYPLQSKQDTALAIINHILKP
jgi:phosphopantothenoylcysteine decarboxylase/phosphopantothenate--cysteine ligase